MALQFCNPRCMGSAIELPADGVVRFNAVIPRCHPQAPVRMFIHGFSLAIHCVQCNGICAIFKLSDPGHNRAIYTEDDEG